MAAHFLAKGHPNSSSETEVNQQIQFSGMSDPGDGESKLEPVVRKIIMEVCGETTVACNGTKFAINSLSTNDNFAGDVVAVSVDIHKYLDEGHVDGHVSKNDCCEQPRQFHFALKMMPEDQEGFRNCMLRSMGVFEKEIFFYAHVKPQMEAFAAGRLAPNKLSSFLPTCFSAQLRPQPYIALENLKAEGFAVPNKFKLLDEDQCRSALVALARFHAISYAMSMAVGDNCNPFGEKDLLESFRGGGQLALEFCNALTHTLLAKMIQVCKRTEMNHFAKELLTFRNKYLVSKESLPMFMRARGAALHVLCHGDLWTTNLMFKSDLKDGCSDPPTVKFLDFQQLTWSSPTLDLYYFLFTSIEGALRRKNLNSFLRIYYQTFQESLDSLKTSRLRLSFQDFLEEFWKRSNFAVVQAIFALPFHLVGDPGSVESEASPDLADVGDTLEDVDLPNGMRDDFSEATKNALIAFGFIGLTMKTQRFRDRIFEVLEECFAHKDDWVDP